MKGFPAYDGTIMGEKGTWDWMLMPKPLVDSSPLDDSKPLPSALQARFGANLRAARIAQSLKQQDLAVKAGLVQQYISRVEDGKINVTLEMMDRLACALGVDVTALLSSPSNNSSDPGD